MFNALDTPKWCARNLFLFTHPEALTVAIDANLFLATPHNNDSWLGRHTLRSRRLAFGRKIFNIFMATLGEQFSEATGTDLLHQMETRERIFRVENRPRIHSLTLDLNKIPRQGSTAQDNGNCESVSCHILKIFFHDDRRLNKQARHTNCISTR